MDQARCTCLVDAEGTRVTRHPDCPFHGITRADPALAYTLTFNDKRFLQSLKIDSEDIEDTRQADEDRFKP